MAYENKPIRWRLMGDRKSALSMTQRGMQVLNQLRNIVSVPGVKQNMLTRYFGVKDWIRAISHPYGIDEIQIMAEMPVLIYGEEKVSKVFFGGTSIQPYTYSGGYESWILNKKDCESGANVWYKNEYESYIRKAVRKIDYYGNNLYVAGSSQRYDPNADDGAGAYVDIYQWIVEKRTDSGDVLWTKTDGDGTYLSVIVDIVADSTGVYAVGGNWNPRAQESRIEKRELETGDLVWETTLPVQESGTTLSRAVDCAIDSDYLYVTDFRYWLVGSTGHYQGRVYKVDKEDGTATLVYSDTEYTTPLESHVFAYEIAIATKSKTGSGDENVFLFNPKFLKPLSQDWSNTVDYAYVYIDYTTTDVGVCADESGIYTVGMVNSHDTSRYVDGYEVCKWNFDGERGWTTIYNDGISNPPTAYFGPMLTAIAVNELGIYVSGFSQITATGIDSIQQCFVKGNGDILWTETWDLDIQNFTYGVCAVTETEEVI